MSYNNYLLNLANISNEIGYSLTYGYGDIAATEINSLKALIAKSEEMIPILEAEACFNEAEELDREERSFNYWMTMLYGKGKRNEFSPMDSHSSSKANRLKRRKTNKKHHKADRYHGKRLMPYKYKEDGVIKDGISWVYHDCHWEVEDKVKYSDNAMKAREQEYYSTVYFTEEAKEAEMTEATEEEAGTFDDFLWFLIDTLSEGKYIILYSFDNGQSYENHDGYANEFKGVMTKDEVIAKLTDNLLRNDGEVEVNETEIRGLKGTRFNWDFGIDEYWDEWNGYESFTIIPVSELN